jgi:anti-sigma-K factor RskA
VSPDLHTLSGAYSLDAMPAEERAQFEDHLAQCDSCAEEVLELRATAARLGAAVAADPPPHLRERVLGEASRTRQLPPVPAPVAARRPSRTALRLLAVAAAVLAVLAGALGVAAYRADQRADRIAAESRQVTRVLGAGDAVTVSGAVEGGGRGTVVASRRLGEVAFVADDLPEAGGARTYQLWLIPARGPARSAGLIGGEGGDRRELVAGDLSDVATFGVSVEPEGGSPQPTRPVLLLPLRA